jgi:hypothetical protein
MLTGTAPAWDDEEPAGDAGVGFQLPEVLARCDVLAFEELAGQGGAGALPPLPGDGRGGPAPLPRGAGDVPECEPDVAGGGAQPRGGADDGKPACDDEVGDGDRSNPPHPDFTSSGRVQ